MSSGSSSFSSAGAEAIRSLAAKSRSRIQVRFAPSVAQYVREAKWHPSQRPTPQRDGSLLAEFELAILPSPPLLPRPNHVYIVSGWLPTISAT